MNGNGTHYYNLLFKRFNIFYYFICKSGFVGAIPHLIMTSLVPIGGMMADYLRKNNIMTTTNVRKLFNCGGFGLEAFFFVLIAYADNKVRITYYVCIGTYVKEIYPISKLKAISKWGKLDKILVTFF